MFFHLTFLILNHSAQATRSLPSLQLTSVHEFGPYPQAMAKKGEGPGWAFGPNFREKAVYTYIYIYIYMDMMGWDVMGCFGKCNVGQCAVYTCQKSRLRQPFLGHHTMMNKFSSPKEHPVILGFQGLVLRYYWKPNSSLNQWRFDSPNSSR